MIIKQTLIFVLEKLSASTCSNANPLLKNTLIIICEYKRALKRSLKAMYKDSGGKQKKLQALVNCSQMFYYMNHYSLDEVHMYTNSTLHYLLYLLQVHFE